MQKLIVVCLLLAGFIKFYPLIGILSAEQLAQLYQIRFEGDALILMRHRAVLFGLLGGLIWFSVFRPALRPLAIAAGLISAGIFIALALTAEVYSPTIHKIVVADIIVVVALLTAWFLEARLKQARLP